MLSISTSDWVTREENDVTEPYQIWIQWKLYTKISMRSSCIQEDWKLTIYEIVNIMWQPHNLWDMYRDKSHKQESLKEILKKVWLI